MASVQEPGLVRIIGRSPNGREVPLWEGDVNTSAPKGGSPDGANSSTPALNERLFVPLKLDVVLTDNAVIYVEFTPVATDGIDFSDCIWSIPVTTVNGVKYISSTQFANHAGVDVTATAGVPVRLAGYKVTEGKLQFGGGPMYVDIQDDTV